MYVGRPRYDLLSSAFEGAWELYGRSNRSSL
jgi:hypothetical protein